MALFFGEVRFHSEGQDSLRGFVKYPGESGGKGKDPIQWWFIWKITCTRSSCHKVVDIMICTYLLCHLYVIARLEHMQHFFFCWIKLGLEPSLDCTAERQNTHFWWHKLNLLTDKRLMSLEIQTQNWKVTEIGPALQSCCTLPMKSTFFASAHMSSLGWSMRHSLALTHKRGSRKTATFNIFIKLSHWNSMHILVQTLLAFLVSPKY